MNAHTGQVLFARGTLREEFSLSLFLQHETSSECCFGFSSVVSGEKVQIFRGGGKLFFFFCPSDS